MGFLSDAIGKSFKNGNFQPPKNGSIPNFTFIANRLLPGEYDSIHSFAKDLKKVTNVGQMRSIFHPDGRISIGNRSIQIFQSLDLISFDRDAIDISQLLAMHIEKNPFHNLRNCSISPLKSKIEEMGLKITSMEDGDRITSPAGDIILRISEQIIEPKNKGALDYIVSPIETDYLDGLRMLKDNFWINSQSELILKALFVSLGEDMGDPVDLKKKSTAIIEIIKDLTARFRKTNKSSLPLDLDYDEANYTKQGGLQKDISNFLTKKGLHSFEIPSLWLEKIGAIEKKVPSTSGKETRPRGFLETAISRGIKTKD